jgi:ATP-binding cassette subfamily F protein 3
VVLVSHDRHLLTATSDSLWLVADGHCRPFDGDLDDYARWLVGRSTEPGKGKGAEAGAGQPGRKRRHAAAGQGQQPRLQDRLGQLDARLSHLHAELAILDQQLADPGLYAGGREPEAARLQAARQEIRGGLETAEKEWLRIAEEIETGDT